MASIDTKSGTTVNAQTSCVIDYAYLMEAGFCATAPPTMVFNYTGTLPASFIGYSVRKTNDDSLKRAAIEKEIKSLQKEVQRHPRRIDLQQRLRQLQKELTRKTK